MAVLIMDFSQKYSLSFFNPIWIVTVKGKSVQLCEHGLVENLSCVCVCVALVNSSIKAVSQVRKPESLGVAKNHRTVLSELCLLVSGTWPSPPASGHPKRRISESRSEKHLCSSCICLLLSD